MIHLQIDPLLDVSIDISSLETAANLVVEQVKPGQESDLSIILTTDKKIKELNRDYRKMDEITDVLSFPSMEIDPDSGKLYLGDVIISLPLAEKQADSAGHSLMAELNLLVAHGVLHLLGYDHGTMDDKKIMWSFQDTILKELGLSGIKINTDQE